MSTANKDFMVGILGIITSLYLWLSFIPRTVIVRGEVHYFFRDPQFTPKLWTGLIFISSVGILYHAVQKKGSQVEESIKKSHGKTLLKENMKVILLMGIMCGFVFLMPRVDYRILTSGGIMAALICFGYIKPIQIIGISGTTALVMYYFFSSILKINL